MPRSISREAIGQRATFPNFRPGYQLSSERVGETVIVSDIRLILNVFWPLLLSRSRICIGRFIYGLL